MLRQLKAALALHRLRTLYARIPQQDRITLVAAALHLAADRHPRRVWIYVPDPRDGEPFEIV